MTPAEIKGMPVWGGQNGLLSVTELTALADEIQRWHGDSPRVLEIGHYFGLSTCLLVHALREHFENWSLVSVDAHVPDPWVTNPATIDDFERNRRDSFADERLEVRYELSQTLVAPLEFDIVFYDGDHGAEQMRFTREVVQSPTVKVFVFDDCDFEVPRECRTLLRDHGWMDVSPMTERHPGDKINPATQTLAILRAPPR